MAIAGKPAVRFARSAKELAKERAGKSGAPKAAKPFPRADRPAKAPADARRRPPRPLPEIGELSGEYGLSEEEARSISERIERGKRLIIVSGVSFFMVLVLVFWLASARQAIVKIRPDDGASAGLSAIWQDINLDLEKSLETAGGSATALALLKQKLATATSAPPQAPAAPETLAPEEDSRSGDASLPAGLGLLMDRIASSTD